MGSPDRLSGSTLIEWALPRTPPEARTASGRLPLVRRRSETEGRTQPWDSIGYLISLAIVGLVIGGLGRLIVPGPNPIGLLATMGVGLAGSILGAIVGGLLGLGAISIVFELAISAGLVYVVGGRNGRGRELTR